MSDIDRLDFSKPPNGTRCRRCSVHSDVRPTVVIVGESPPPKATPSFVPFDCDSGERLARKAIGLLSRTPFLAHVPRVNVFDEPGVGVTPGKTWPQALAEEGASRIIANRVSTRAEPATLIMMGDKVKAAFGRKNMSKFTWETMDVIASDPFHLVACPHPSGQNTSLNIASVQSTTRRLLIPELVAGCSGLRPWHWHLDDRAVLADLGAALCPTQPVLGIAIAVAVRDLYQYATAQRPGEKDLAGTADWAHTLLDLMQAAHDGPDRVLDLWQVEGKKRRDLRARMKSVKNSGIVDDYPPEVLRATMGRYVALGVL